MACSASIGWGGRPGARLGTFLLVAWAAGESGYAQTVESLVREAERLGVTTGILVRDAGASAPLFAHNATRAFAPASNMKLLSAVAVAAGLGMDYRFRTEFELRDGVLRVRAGGDPGLRSGTVQDPARVFGAVAQRLVAEGIDRIVGLALDQGAFTGPTRPAGWPADQLEFYYCAPTGGLVLEEGCFRLRIRAGSGTRAAVELLSPPTELRTTGSITMTGDRRKGSVYGVSDRGGQLRLFGNFYRNASPALVVAAVKDPADWFAAALESALARAGVRVDPTAPPRDLSFPAHETPLVPTLRRALVHSSNFAAEQTLRVLGAELLGDGSLQGGIEAMQRQLEELVGNLPRSTHLADASGLSRSNRVTAAVIVEVLLAAVSAQPAVLDLLPRPGGEGTLAARFVGSTVAARVRAKTGWIAGTSALSGILETKNGDLRPFAILMSYDPQRSGLNAQLKKLQERMVEAIDRLPGASRDAMTTADHGSRP